MQKKTTILLVEDNPGDARLTEEMLGESSTSAFDLTVAATLREAREKLGKASFDLILLDLGLPDSQGLSTFFSIRKTAPHVPIVVMTGFQDETLGIEAVHEGAQDYLKKGEVDSAFLIRSIHYGIERNSDLMELRRLNGELEEQKKDLEEALSRIKILSGLLPICASCKKIRDDKGYWKQVESYITEHSEATFSHGMCPECVEKEYPEIFEESGEKKTE